VLIDKPVICLIILGLLLSSFSFFLQPLSPFSSIAHRGASAYAPENTMASFHKAVELGFDYIEFDVRLSKDEELVVIHDPNVMRTTNGEGLVEDLTVEELKKLDAGSWFDSTFEGETIPLLSEVIEKFGAKIGLLIELKSPKQNGIMSEKLAHMLQSSFDRGLNPDTIKVQSFHPQELKRFSSLCPDVSVGIVVNKTLNMLHLASYRSFASFISIHQQFISRTFMKQAKLFNFEVYSWTIHKQRQFLAMQSLSVNGIISDLEKKETNDSPILTALFIKGQLFLRTFV
jgi:glycerophosphoryl diester phosphodiesterase